MNRLAMLAVVGLVLGTADSAWAQKGPRPGNPGSAPGIGEELKKLQAELDKLQGLIKEVESKLRKAKEPAPQAAPKGPPATPFAGPGKFGPPHGRFGQHGHWGAGPMGKGWQGNWPHEREDKSPPAATSVEKRLDKIENDIEEIKRLLTRGPKR